jgi:hypothetical protein
MSSHDLALCGPVAGHYEKDMSGTTGGGDSGKTEAERRKERLARALRENLKRRKEQARGRKPGDRSGAPPKGPGSGR